MNTVVSSILAVLVCLLGLQTWRLSSLQSEMDHERAERAEFIADAEAKAREQERTFADNARKAADAYSKQVTKVRAAADGARTELDGLRDTLATAGAAASSPGTACRADDAANARIVVGECASTLQAVAAAADELEARLIGLQDYVKATRTP